VFKRKKKLCFFFINSILLFNILVGLPMRRYQNQLLNVPIDSSSLLISSDKNNPQQQRAKRIYWENLAFHAGDYNQKGKQL
jgi:hypothetical protein